MWFAVLATCLVLTVSGRNVLDLILSQLFPCCWNDWVVRCILRRNPDRARLLIRRFHRRHQERMEQRLRDLRVEVQPTPQQAVRLGLKTRVFDASKDTSFDKEVLETEGDPDDEALVDHLCSICFGLIQDGERVGNLPCSHLFHVDCLKSWLARRNVCPLCLQANVAVPLHAEEGVDAPSDMTGEHANANE
jgi:hypothetical protein